MRTTGHHPRPRRARGARLARLLLAALVLAGTETARAAQLIPSIGVTKSAKTADERAELYAGLAVRGHLVPFLESEIGVAYRRESRLDGDLVVRMWPVTTSLWLTPLPLLYAGGGVGWYHTSLDYSASQPLLQDETRQKFGVHLGGGVQVPLAAAMALDLNGRYVFLTTERSQLPPNRFDPDFWTTTLGLAIRF